MGNLFLILTVLFISLFIIVTLIERYGKPMSQEEQSKISRLVLPLLAILLVGQALFYFLK